jgi:hypothetical protein
MSKYIWSNHPRSKIHKWKIGAEILTKTLCGKTLVAYPVKFGDDIMDAPLDKELCGSCWNDRIDRTSAQRL